MLLVYINYPNPHISIHADPSCRSIMNHQKQDQRIIKINIDNFSTEIKKFRNKEYRFAAEQALNDMWLNIDFGNVDFENSIVNFIHQILSRHYLPFKDQKTQHHCG